MVVDASALNLITWILPRPGHAASNLITHKPYYIDQMGRWRINRHTHRA